MISGTFESPGLSFVKGFVITASHQREEGKKTVSKNKIQPCFEWRVGVVTLDETVEPVS